MNYYIQLVMQKIIEKFDHNFDFGQYSKLNNFYFSNKFQQHRLENLISEIIAENLFPKSKKNREIQI
jgi:hypothetical protein